MFIYIFPCFFPKYNFLSHLHYLFHKPWRFRTKEQWIEAFESFEAYEHCSDDIGYFVMSLQVEFHLLVNTRTKINYIFFRADLNKAVQDRCQLFSFQVILGGFVGSSNEWKWICGTSRSLGTHELSRDVTGSPGDVMFWW